MRHSDLLDDGWARFLDENATGIGLPPSERLARARERKTPWEKIGEAITVAMAEFGRAIAEFGQRLAREIEKVFK